MEHGGRRHRAGEMAALKAVHLRFPHRPFQQLGHFAGQARWERAAAEEAPAAPGRGLSGSLLHGLAGEASPSCVRLLLQRRL
jgi:hypothetical protein